MECPYCHGALKAGTTSYTVNRNGYQLIIDELPALICEQCRKPLYSEDAVRLVQQMVRTLDARHKELSTITLLA